MNRTMNMRTGGEGTVTVTKVADRLHAVVLLDGHKYPHRLSLRECIEDEYNTLRMQILQAAEDAYSVRIVS